jgi:galactitol-specific phosphotransferase system IIC component
MERVKSAKLAKIVTAIVEKLENAIESVVERLMERVGSSLPHKLSLIAVGWGNPAASQWAHDRGFIRFLAVNYMNTPDGYRGAG